MEIIILGVILLLLLIHLYQKWEQQRQIQKKLRLEIRMLNKRLRRKEPVSSQEINLVINTFKIDKTMAAPRR